MIMEPKAELNCYENAYTLAAGAFYSFIASDNPHANRTFDLIYINRNPFLE